MCQQSQLGLFISSTHSLYPINKLRRVNIHYAHLFQFKTFLNLQHVNCTKCDMAIIEGHT